MPRRHRLSLIVVACALTGLFACADESSTGLNLTPNQNPDAMSMTPGVPSTPDVGQQPPAGCVPSCGPGTSCRNGACVPSSTPMTPANSGAAIGAACAKSSECGERVCLSPKSYPQGYCSKFCGGDIISEGSACPNGSICFQLSETAAFCLDTCQANGDCRTGYVCAPSGKDKACVPRCSADGDCATGQACNTTSGLCETAQVATPGQVGAPCMMDAQCTGGKCLDPTGTIFVGGTCIAACTKAEVDKACAGGRGTCVDLSDAMNPDTYVCFGACTTGTDCRKEYLCSLDAGPASTAGFCVPRCEHYECQQGETCDTSVGVCVSGTSVPTGSSQIVHTDFGNKPIGSDSDADLATVEIDVPADGISFSLIVKAAMATTTAIVQIVDPKGNVVYQYGDPNSTAYKAYISSFLPGTLGTLFPNAPRLNLIPGKYTVKVGTNDKTTAKIDALVKRQSGVISGGNLPVVFWFTKNKYLNAESAKTNAAFQQIIKEFDSIYSSIGIKVGPITYRDVTGPNAEAWAVPDDFSKLGPLFENANSSNERALHFFMIDQFTFDGGETLLGISGGIPGPPAYPNLLHGGVAVALAFLNKPAVFAETIAHEGGHFLGLWHPSEREGKAHDPLVDTVECGASKDTNGDGLVTARECPEGQDNLMCWTTGPVPQRKLTNDQRFVLLRNPAVE